MFNFITEAIKQRQESRQQAQAKPKKEKKEKIRKEKGKPIILIRELSCKIFLFTSYYVSTKILYDDIFLVSKMNKHTQ